MTVLEYIADLLYPVKCPFCGGLTGRGDSYVCEDCLNKLPWVREDDRVQSFPYIERCTAPFYYENSVRESVHRYKFSGKNAYARVYADFIRKAIDENEISCDIITWVPLSRRRYRQRGYDQARLIAEYISKASGTACLRLLKKTRNNPAQSGTGGKSARMANVAGVYEAVNVDKLRDKRILIVDDVVTTGSTLSECAKMLKQAGAVSVCAAALARHNDCQ